MVLGRVFALSGVLTGALPPGADGSELGLDAGYADPSPYDREGVQANRCISACPVSKGTQPPRRRRLGGMPITTAPPRTSSGSAARCGPPPITTMLFAEGPGSGRSLEALARATESPGRRLRPRV